MNIRTPSVKELAEFVIENGRVVGKGAPRLESLRVGVEFEARERGLENSDAIAAAVVELFGHGGQRIRAGRPTGSRNPHAGRLGSTLTLRVGDQFREGWTVISANRREAVLQAQDGGGEITLTRQ